MPEYKDYHVEDNLSGSYTTSDTTSSVYTGLTTLCDPANIKSSTNGQVVYNSYGDNVQQRQKEFFQPQVVAASAVPSAGENPFSYTGHHQQQQAYFYQPLLPVTTSTSTEVTVRNSSNVDYYGREVYQQQAYFHPPSYNGDLVDASDNVRLRHHDVTQDNHESATVSPIINIQDLTGYTGRSLHLYTKYSTPTSFKRF